MSLWSVMVEVQEEPGSVEVIVLAGTELGARQMATREIVERGFTGAHSVGAQPIDPFKPGVVTVVGREVTRV